MERRRFTTWPADMGGMGFIERFRVECLPEHTHQHAHDRGRLPGWGKPLLLLLLACVYNTTLQQDPNVRELKESDAYPAMAERGYGWEKLISEMFCQEYWAERGLKTFVARFHNVYVLTAPGTAAAKKPRPRFVRKGCGSRRKR